MELPASLREINPLIDAIARGEEPPHDGAGLRLAVALGLVTPGYSSLTEAGRAYACPALAAGPTALVMSPGRRAAAEPLLGGGQPLQATLRRLLRRILAQGEHLVSPLALGWPEALLRPYLAYLEDLGLLVPIGPLVEVTPRGRTVAGWPEPAVAAGGLATDPAGAGGGAEHRAPTPHWSSPVFRYHLVRQVCLTLITLRGRREWHKLEPLLEGPLLSLKPAYTEWLARFQAAQPAMRRSWHPSLVEQFAQREPAPPWFAMWCRALLNTEPEGAADTLAQTPALLHDPALLCKTADDGPINRAVWLVATALAWAARRGRTLKYAEAAARFRLDGVQLPAWPAMQPALEETGLLVAGYTAVQLLLPVEVQAPAGALWPYAGPEWVAAALLEGGAFAVAAGVRRPERV